MKNFMYPAAVVMFICVMALLLMGVNKQAPQKMESRKAEPVASVSMPGMWRVECDLPEADKLVTLGGHLTARADGWVLTDYMGNSVFIPPDIVVTIVNQCPTRDVKKVKK